MDIETLTNHISRLGKRYFDDACKLVLEDVFQLQVVNVDGKNDGGTDFTSFNSDGGRTDACYQITTQKSAIKNKAYRDAKKVIEKLGANRFYFLTTLQLPETESRKIEHEITKDLGIPSTCLTSRNIAGLLLSENLLNKFLDTTDYPLPSGYSGDLEYREMALHSYTLFSDDASKLKHGIYDDTMLYVLSNKDELDEQSLISQTTSFLSLEEDKIDVLEKRIGALFGRNMIKRTESGNISLTADTKEELSARKSLYSIELSSLASAQIDILRTEFATDWSEEDSKKVAIWIANAFVSDQIENLKEVKANIVSNPIFDLEENGVDKIRNFLITRKGTDRKTASVMVEKLLENAAGHPLITKISRATVYVALQGANPISSAKALGASRWSEFKILVEPTVAIPYICAQLYSGRVNRYFDCAIQSIKRSQKLSAKLYIPYFYINECAGHLLKARRYNDLNLNEEELRYSNNAFVANYYALKSQGINLPESFMDYLCSFSTAIRTERLDVKSWIRAIMTDIQSTLNKAGVEFIDVPFYDEGDCADFEKEYMYQLNEYEIEKKSHLIKHDTYALQFTADKIANEGEHWIVLTYDRSMIGVSRSDIYKGWITNPFKFLDFTEASKPLSETKLISLVHSVATFSEKTLAAGARIIDRIVKYASKEMQNWEFKQEMEQFKNEMIMGLDLNHDEYDTIEIDKKTDEFLKKHGIDQVETEEDVDE